MQMTIQDETMRGEVRSVMTWVLDARLMTVRDIVTRRVGQEVAEYNQKLSGRFMGLVQPTDAEITLNGYQPKPKQPIDAAKQIAIALDAFNRNGYFVLVDNKQAESLDEEIILNKNTVVSFIKLTPLVGG